MVSGTSAERVARERVVRHLVYRLRRLGQGLAVAAEGGEDHREVGSGARVAGRLLHDGAAAGSERVEVVRIAGEQRIDAADVAVGEAGRSDGGYSSTAEHLR